MSGSCPNLTGQCRFGIMGLLLALLAATGLNHSPAEEIQDVTPANELAQAMQDGTSASKSAKAIQDVTPANELAQAMQDVTPASRTVQAMQADSSPARPNIIVIMSDDQGWNDIGYHGSEILTPNLDRLAKEGVRFSQFYAYSTCSPSRVALLTGQHPAALGVFGPLWETT